MNGAFRNAVQLQSFAPQGDLAWRQIAQDGVQFAYATYNTIGAVNSMINMAPANRVDLLVKAPVQPGRYTLTAQPNEGLPLDPSAGFAPDAPITLLTVSVEGPAVSPAQDFIQKEGDFPTFPKYLADIPMKAISFQREVTFGAGNNLIDGKTFNQKKYSQTMQLNSAEEWKISNQANDKSHPFHIHVNPFQITEVFQPNAENTTDPNQPCYVDPLNPQTWKPCTPIKAPYVWWDTFAIPTGKQVDVTAQCNGNKCPPAIQPYVQCTTKDGTTTCIETIPGYFKMRSRFVDFTGTYVLHCHILIHEDRGMMQLVEVVRSKPYAPVAPSSPYMHH